MGMVVNTNINALNAQVNTNFTNRALTSSLEKLSSGLRINKAADDSSGLAIADSLRSQANSLGQAIRNANDAIGMIQIADKAIDEQVKILDTIKAKSVQASQDSQNTDSRKAIQADINRLIEQLDNIAGQTQYNGISMLAGTFTNKEFQVGANSNQVIKASIGATQSDKIGSVRKETTSTITAAGSVSLTFKNPTGGSDITLESVIISSGSDTGVGVLAETINKNSDALGVRATYSVQTTGSTAVAAGDVQGLTINGIAIGDINNVKVNDDTGELRNAINAYSAETGVVASVDESGRLNLTSNSGRGIAITTTAADSVTGVANFSASENYGRLTLTQLGANDIIYSAGGSSVMTNTINANGSNANYNLRDVTGSFTAEQGNAAGAYANTVLSGDAGTYLGAGVVTREGAQIVNDIASSAIKQLDRVRSDIGSVQSQLNVTVNAISVAEVNVRAAESGIRDVDFGSESANFSKQNILAQSGSYALTQANAVQQNVLRLLQ